MKCIILLASIVLVQGYAIKDNEIETGRIQTSDDLLNSVISDCFEAESPVSCLKVKVLSFLDTKLGVTSESARAFEETNIDKVSFRADRGFDVDFPEEQENGNSEARGILKKKLLLPILLLLKLKMKALMPILVAIIGIKSIKAFIYSKIAITLVLGFLIYNLLQKKGMPMMMAPTEGPPAPQYGPPASQYGPPSTAAAPTDSYGPPAQWEPSNANPYSRIWDPSQMAYNSYYPGDSGASSSANQSPNDMDEIMMD
ncbi:hypothetical protein NE865_02284 [Phthorimaea operculella]|nr:hypothetical protein NE865_02284 [Phthorimaea operculella]